MFYSKISFSAPYILLSYSCSSLTVQLSEQITWQSCPFNVELCLCMHARTHSEPVSIPQQPIHKITREHVIRQSVGLGGKQCA